VSHRSAEYPRKRGKSRKPQPVLPFVLKDHPRILCGNVDKMWKTFAFFRLFGAFAAARNFSLTLTRTISFALSFSLSFAITITALMLHKNMQQIVLFAPMWEAKYAGRTGGEKRRKLRRFERRTGIAGGSKKGRAKGANTCGKGERKNKKGRLFSPPFSVLWPPLPPEAAPSSGGANRCNGAAACHFPPWRGWRCHRPPPPAVLLRG